MSEAKPKRQLSEEQLKKLAIAREKAMEVRKKKALITKAEKLEKAKELDENYKKVIGQKDDVPPPPQESQQEPKAVEQRKKSKIKKVLRPASDESSSDSSDEEYDASEVAHKYRQKYKTKYEAKYGSVQHVNNPYNTTPYQDAFTIAKHNLQGKLSNEIKKMAYGSLFG